MVGRLLLSSCLVSCISISGSARTHVAIDDHEARRGSGQIQLGSLTELVADRLTMQLFYARDLGAVEPLEAQPSESLGVWGGRLLVLSRGRRPGLYVSGAWGEKDDVPQTRTSSAIFAVGAAYAVMRSGTGAGRALAGVTLGLVGHRQRHAAITNDEPAYFLGIELGFVAGLDALGPLWD